MEAPGGPGLVRSLIAARGYLLEERKMGLAGSCDGLLARLLSLALAKYAPNSDYAIQVPMLSAFWRGDKRCSAMRAEFEAFVCLSEAE